jgi:APA family basic amino acid/polyamine antiporter
MAGEEMVYARKASGLVRGLSLWDAFGIGFLDQGLLPSMVVMCSLGVGVYTRGNLIVAVLLSTVFCGIGFPIVWGVLGGSMPRSGGEYIYNSRILHPIIGIAESFGNAWIWVMWIYVIGPWIADPGLAMVAQFTGWHGLADFATSQWGGFAVASAANLISFLLVAFGIKILARAQILVITVGMSATVMFCLVLSLYGKQDFVNAWNHVAAQYGSLDYSHFLAGVEKLRGETFANTWTWFDSLGVMVAACWAFAYAYCITFIAGEVKRPEKTIILANLFAVLIPGAFCLWMAVALYHAVDFNFLSAAFWFDNSGEQLAGFNLPFSTNVIDLAYVLVPNGALGFLYGLGYMAFGLWWVALGYIATPRIMFAWGMDRMGPKWFTDISPRWGTPYKNNALVFVLGEILIAVYIFWTANPIQGLAVTGLEVVTVFGVTAIAALVFPYRKKVRGIWNASPYSRWKLFGIPVLTIGAVVDLIYLAILFVFFFIMPDLRSFTVGAVFFYVGIWTLGILWYFFWKWRSKGSGIDASIAFGQLPPE